MNYGLEQNEIDMLVNVFRTFPMIECVRLYGSRAKGTYKTFSDVDITLDGEDITHDDLMDVCLKVDNLLLPYIFDISISKNLNNANLIDHINRRGISIYTKA